MASFERNGGSRIGLQEQISSTLLVEGKYARSLQQQTLILSNLPTLFTSVDNCTYRLETAWA